jgi:hypothetical protein
LRRTNCHHFAGISQNWGNLGETYLGIPLKRYFGQAKRTVATVKTARFARLFACDRLKSARAKSPPLEWCFAPFPFLAEGWRMSKVTHIEPKRSTLVGRLGTLARSRSALRRNVWIWPILAAPLIAAFGFFIYSSVESSLRDNVADQLVAVRDSELEALKIWMEIQRNTAATLASNQRISSVAVQLVDIQQAAPDDRAALIESPLAVQFAEEISAHTKMHSYDGHVLMDESFVIVASSHAELIGKSDGQKDERYAAVLLAGKPLVTRPFPSTVLLKDLDGKMRAGVPTMFAAAPILDDEGKLRAILGLRIRPEEDFTRILSVGHFGQTGETYAFDDQGVVLSRTRFEDQVKQLGLIQDKPHVTTVHNLELRDPGTDLTQSARPAQPRSQQPLTKMAASAVEGRSGVDVHGYRDYRGVNVVGAWIWLPEYGFGVATEMDSSEAFAAANFIRWAHRGLFTLLGILTIAMFGATWVMAKAERQAREASLAAKKIGQYHLEQKLGQGGMGVVYAGTHAMLRRPTAVKMLDPHKTTDESIARFEREVQLSSRLNHPNTITIYDYGRTDEGVFFYAMELLDGIDLDQLVSRFGPQPPGRVAHLLIQACGSLHEAHSAGLIHRDIKPGNLMLTQRGGISDFVKVLDFGLVKAIDAQKEQSLTAANTLTGTPLYMSPEAIELPDEVDGRSDLYALAAVGYFLVTGTPVFSGKTVVDICMQQVSAAPMPPSERLGREVPAALEEALLAGLAKQASDRPQSAREFSKLLEAVVREMPWTVADADRWWATYTTPDMLETRDHTTKRLVVETQISAQSQ